MRAVTAVILLAGAAALAGCDRGADTGATSNPNAPGRPGTNNPPVAATPSSGNSNVSPGVGGELGVQPVPGVTGRGDAEPGVSTQPRTGTAGGLGGGTNAAGAGPQQGRSDSPAPSGAASSAPRDNIGGR